METKNCTCGTSKKCKYHPNNKPAPKWDTFGKEITGHTPTPWTWEVDAEDRLVINAPDSQKRIASLLFNSSSMKDISVYKANASFIVHCVNSHQELLEACRALYSVLENFDPENKAMDFAQKAIAKAEGK